MTTMTMPTPRPITRKSTNLTINTTLSPPSAARSPLSPAMIYSPVASPRDKDSAVQALLQTYDDVTFDFSPSTTTTFPPGSFAARNSVSGPSNPKNSTADNNDDNNNNSTSNLPTITTSTAPTLQVPIPSTPLSPSLRVSWYNLVTGGVTDEVHSIAFHPSPDNESDIKEVRDWCVEQASPTAHNAAEVQGQEIFRFEYGKYSSGEGRRNLKVIKEQQQQK